MSDASPPNRSALVLSGGGARTAYHAGVLRYLAEAFPEKTPKVVTGVGMGGVNAALWAAAERQDDAVAQLVRFWDAMEAGDVFEARSLWDLIAQIMHHTPSENQSLLDLAPLRRRLSALLSPAADDTLPGIADALAAGRLQALALTTSRYATQQTVTWTQTAPGCPPMDGWVHDRRRAVEAKLTMDHVVASAALALLFPAVRIGTAWHGAGVGMLHPLAPALRLGARRLLVVSTRPESTASSAPAEPKEGDPYPSPLQIASLLSNTLLLDAPEQDARTADRIDDLLQRLPAGERPLDPADVLVLRPSTDLTALANDLDVDVDAQLGTTLRYLHAEETALPDLLSVLLYAPDFVRRCLLLGYADAERQHDRIEELVAS